MTKTRRPPSTRNLIAKHLHDQVCPCGRRDVAPATDGGLDHAARTQLPLVRELQTLAAGDDKPVAIGAVIVLTHDRLFCAPTIDAQTFPDGCGTDRARHLLWLAAHPRMHVLLRLLDLPVPEAPAP